MWSAIPLGGATSWDMVAVHEGQSQSRMDKNRLTVY